MTDDEAKGWPDYDVAEFHPAMRRVEVSKWKIRSRELSRIDSAHKIISARSVLRLEVLPFK